MRLFIFGAGTTIGTLGLPGVKGFEAELAKRVPGWRTKFGALASVVDAVEPQHRRSPNDWDLDAVWTHVDFVAKFFRSLDAGPFPCSASTELHAAISEVYGEFQRGRVLDPHSCFTLREALVEVQKDDVVVSFNWDVLVEVLLQPLLASRGLNLVQAPYPCLNDSVRFSKPHGSLTWNRHQLQAHPCVAAPISNPD